MPYYPINEATNRGNIPESLIMKVKSTDLSISSYWKLLCPANDSFDWPLTSLIVCIKNWKRYSSPLIMTLIISLYWKVTFWFFFYLKLSQPTSIYGELNHIAIICSLINPWMLILIWLFFKHICLCSLVRLKKSLSHLEHIIIVLVLLLQTQFVFLKKKLLRRRNPDRRVITRDLLWSIDAVNDSGLVSWSLIHYFI